MSLLEQRGHSVELVGGSKPKNKYKQFLRSFYSIKFRNKILNAVNRFQPDIVFAHSICYNVSPSFLRRVNQRNVPIVLTVPEIAQLSYQFPNLPAYFVPASFFRKFVQRRFLRRYIDLVIAPSNVAADHIRTALATDDVVRIPHPAFWELTNEPLERSLNRVLFVGRLDPNKGVETLVRGFAALVHSDERDAILEIIGEGPAEDALQKITMDEGIEDKVEFKGYLEHERVKERYQDAAVFVLPSEIPENCPMTIIEALSQGPPVITTNIGGQSELIKSDSDYGVLYDPGNEQQLVEALERIIWNDERIQSMSISARNRSKDFSPTEHVKELEQLFEDLI
jgi:glycosyltransferase involved in cell wall biosynthesis